MSRVLHAGASPAALGVARSAVFSTAFVLVLLHPLAEFARLPAAWYDPVGPMRLLPPGSVLLLLDGGFLAGLRMALLALCALLALGIRPFTPLAVACAVLLVIFDAIMKGFGSYVNHAETTLLLAVWILALFPASDGFSVLGPARKPARAGLYAAPLVLGGLFLAATYMLLGIRRFFHGGYEIFTGDAILRYLSVNSLNYSAFGYEHGLLVLSHPWMGWAARAAFLAVTFAELLAPLALFHQGFRRGWLLVMLPMHLGTLFFMNILFWEQMVLVLVFLTGLPHLAADAMPVFAARTAGQTETGNSRAGRADPG